jgi:hypothetical protein
MLSDLLYDLNNRTAKTTLNLSVSDIIIDGEASENTAFLSLGLLHDADTGDSSLDLSLGLGTENAKSAGVYITDGTAVLKSGSTENKILLYPMPEAPGAGNTFLDQASILLTGLLSEDGAAYTFDRNRSDRMELCARYLDPWLEDTSLEEYSEEEITMKLAGKDVPLRSVTLSMSGQRAYDFVLGNMLALSGDVQFADMDALLAGLVNFLSDDLYNLIQSVVSDGEELSDYIESATGKLVDELQALTPEEISAAKFIVSILFNGDRPIGINIEASTTNKAFILDAILYRNGLEHEVCLNYQCIDGTTANIRLSTVGTGGDNYDVSGLIEVQNAQGLKTYSGGYSGKLIETKSLYDLKGSIGLNVQYIDEDGVAQSGAINGDLNLNIAHDESGYSGTCTLLTDIQTESALSAVLTLDAGMDLSAPVEIVPPMYVESNTTTISNKNDLIIGLGGDAEELGKHSGLIEDILVLIAFIIG